MDQAEESMCSKEEGCERALHVGRIVVAHYGRKILNRRVMRDGAGGKSNRQI